MCPRFTMVRNATSISFTSAQIHQTQQHQRNLRKIVSSSLTIITHARTRMEMDSANLIHLKAKLWAQMNALRCVTGFGQTE